jgi:uncharacterized protein (DUF4213/DUF364 family)
MLTATVPTATAQPVHVPGSTLRELHAHALEQLGAQGLQQLTIRRAVLGLFFTGVELDNGAGGLCATPIKTIPQAVCCPSSAQAMPIPGKIAGRSVAEVLQDLHRPQELRRALAIATLNAVAETLWQRSGPPPGARVQEGEAFDQLAIAPADRVVLVGAFPPYLRALRRRAQPFHVLELDTSVLKPEELPFHVPPEQAGAVLAQADVLVTTGTTLVNGSLEELLAPLRPGAQVAVIGPTATLLAPPFARRGVSVVGGTRVRDVRALLDVLAEGGSGYHFFGKSVDRVCLCLNQPAHEG